MYSFPHTKRVLPIVLAVVLAATACGSSTPDARPSDVTTSVPENTTADQSTSTTAGAAESLADQNTYVSFGNTDAETVIVVAQGGPIPSLDSDEVQAMFSNLDLEQARVVLPHQAQTLDPEPFSEQEISFEEAKNYDTETTELLANVVRTFVDEDRQVAVVGISFGAFVVQDLLALQGNIADAYLIQVGRLDMPAAVWEPFSQGRFVGFIDGAEIADVDAGGAGMGGDGEFTDVNMAKLAAGLGHKRYTELLADVDLTNVVYAYGETDEQVGRLSSGELAFLRQKGVRVLHEAGGHGEAIDATLQPALEMLVDGISFNPTDPEAAVGSNGADVGYLPADQVEAYVQAFEAGLARSSVAIGGSTAPVRYAGVEDALTIRTDASLVVLELGEAGLEGASVEWNERLWVAQEEPAFAALPEALGGEGELLSMTFPAAATEDPTDTIDVVVNLDINIIGMGDSAVDVIDGYATISGTLGTSTYSQLADVMTKYAEVDTLVMMNVQGSENDEINVHTARLIREAGWTTWVPSNGDISSGGVDMFVAGVERIVEPGSFVGVHSWGAGDGELTGRDYPRDSPVHRSQLEYYSEMMGQRAGTDFYFYTLDAAPFEQIHRMTFAELTEYDLITADAPESLPEAMIGHPAGYLTLADGIYLKVQVEACRLNGGEVEATLSSGELGPLELSVGAGRSALAIPSLEGLAPIDHDLLDVVVADGFVAGTVNLELAAVVDFDTSEAAIEFPCAG